MRSGVWVAPAEGSGTSRIRGEVEEFGGMAHTCGVGNRAQGHRRSLE